MNTGIITFLVVLMVAEYGLPFSVPSTDNEFDHTHVHNSMMEDLADLLEQKLDSSDNDTQATQDEYYIPRHQKDKVLDEISGFLKEINLDFSQDEENDPRYRSRWYKWGKPKPGQKISRCSYYRYGCCRDGSEAPRGKKGCGLRTCSDEEVKYCMQLKKSGRLDCGKYGRHYSMCAHSCNSPCKRPAPARLVRCIARLNPWGCCWNGDPAIGPRQRGCKPCVDRYRHVCNQFKYISGGCNSGSYGIRTFMQKHCYRTCEKCHMHFYAK